MLLAGEGKGRHPAGICEGPAEPQLTSGKLRKYPAVHAGVRGGLCSDRCRGARWLGKYPGKMMALAPSGTQNPGVPEENSACSLKSIRLSVEKRLLQPLGAAVLVAEQ